jgi:shikimate dehydrogenase
VAAVLGHPVAQSLSPAIFEAAFDETGLDWTYVAFDVQPGDVPGALAGVRALGLAGVNVTTPHKEAAFAAVDEATPRAAALGAVNCVTLEDGRLVGDSTDGEGFVAALGRAGFEVAGRRVAVLGAGGAARSMVAALAAAGAAEVGVVNRTASRAAATAALGDGVGRVVGVEDLGGYDVVANATSVGFADPASSPVPAGAVGEGQVAVDAVYHPLRTRFLEDAAAAGAVTLDGLGMLVGQAAVAFERWTGRPAPVDAMRRGAAAALADRTPVG